MDKKSLMLNLCQSKYIKKTKKEELINKIFGDDMSDYSIETKYECYASYPD